MITDWDDAYANGAYIADADSYVPAWEAKSAAFRATHPSQQISYGSHPRQVIDLFTPTTPKGLVVFVHGGYWRSLDRPLWSHLAAGALAHGYAVAMPGYILCPDVSIAEITRQISTAIDEIAPLFAGPIHLTGHSAGGHLVSRMACTDVPLKAAARLKNIVSISGVHDLRPLINTTMNDDFRLDEISAIAESPVFKTPHPHINLTCWVGAAERPEFLRQTHLLANIWTGCGINTASRLARNHHHFSVIEDLENPESQLIKTLLQK